MISGDMCKTTAGHIVSLMLPIHLKLVRSPKLETLCYEEILQTLLNKVCVHSIYYKYEEDERLVYPIVALQNGLKEEVLLLALHDLVAQLPVKNKHYILNRTSTYTEM